MFLNVIKTFRIFSIWMSVFVLPGLLTAQLKSKDVDTVFLIACVFTIFSMIYLNRSAKNKQIKIQ
jgi:hypothetical protein